MALLRQLQIQKHYVRHIIDRNKTGLYHREFDWFAKKASVSHSVGEEQDESDRVTKKYEVAVSALEKMLNINLIYFYLTFCRISVYEALTQTWLSDITRHGHTDTIFLKAPTRHILDTLIKIRIIFIIFLCYTSVLIMFL